jgi:hemerythrin-like domain-containing protein
MQFERQVSRLLHEEHQASIALLGRVEQASVRGAAADRQALAGALARQLEHDTEHHFAFEERELFPRLAESGDDAMAGLLIDEHETLREVAAELLPLARALQAGDAGADAGFRRVALELVERMVAHIQKETMGLLPMLDDLLDEQTDGELALAYAQ